MTLEDQMDRAVDRARAKALDDLLTAGPDCPKCGGELRETDRLETWACDTCEVFIEFTAPDEDCPQGSWESWAMEDE